MLGTIWDTRIRSKSAIDKARTLDKITITNSKQPYLTKKYINERKAEKGEKRKEKDNIKKERKKKVTDQGTIGKP